MSKNLTGPFAARHLGQGAWLLTTGAADGPEVLLLGPGAEAALRDAGPALAVTLTWRHDGVDVALTGPAGVRAVRAAAAIVHEPNARLYQSLPLAGFDAEARRFWRRVFRLIRLPGGRLLLGLIARRKRGRRGPATR